VISKNHEFRAMIISFFVFKPSKNYFILLYENFGIIIIIILLEL